MQGGHHYLGKYAESAREQKANDRQEVPTAGFLKHADVKNATEDVLVGQEAYQ